MKPEARLDSAVFQLTPTRTRCDLVLIFNGRTEKIASGLLNPFLAHLKTAQDQIAKGGYSITLKPDPQTDSEWFTKGTLERFVRFVSTPEVLERVITIESEILQIEEAICIQGNDNLGLCNVEDHQSNSIEFIEGNKTTYDADAEKAIVLYKPGIQPHPLASNGTATQEENSKAQLLRVLETRKIVLQKEQGMAFARAVAAGFDMDNMIHLISFAECFGASRLTKACSQFMELWKRKHETGQWVEVEVGEAMSSRSELPPFNPSGIVLSGDHMKQTPEALPAPSGDVNTGNIGKAGQNTPYPQHPSVSHEYFPGQYHQPAFSPWPMQPPPGPIVYPPYSMQGMPYYQNYPSPSPYFHPPYPTTDDPRFVTHERMKLKKQSVDGKDNVDSEAWEIAVPSTRSQDGTDQSLSEFEKEGSLGHDLRKMVGHSRKKKSGVVVIRNINYIARKKRGSSENDSEFASDSDTEEDSVDAHSNYSEKKHKRLSSSSKKKESRTIGLESSDMYKKDGIPFGQEADNGNWQAFQSFLLRAEEKTKTNDADMFAGEKEPPARRKENRSEVDPIFPPEREHGSVQEQRTVGFDSVSGKTSRVKQISNDELLVLGTGRGLTDSNLKEVEGGEGGHRRASNDDFVVHGRETQPPGRTSLNPLVENEYGCSSNLDANSRSMTDESFMVPLRSASQDHLGPENRTTIDIDSEFPLAVHKFQDSSNREVSQIRYEPDDLTLMPERGIVSASLGYDPAIDYDFQIPLELNVKMEAAKLEEDPQVKEEIKSSEKDKKLGVSQEGLEKRKKDALARKVTTSRMNPQVEAQKRAEKLRAFKADLQKVKKEKEEEQIRRLEALKREREKRIAARSSMSTTSTPKQSNAKWPHKLSPSSYKGSKFSDPEPGSSSPLKRLPIKTASVGSNELLKTTKSSRLNGTAHVLSRSAPSLAEMKKERKETLESTAETIQTKKLSDPKSNGTNRASMVKPVSTAQSLRKSTVDESQTKKISAIKQLDQSKSATLPELRVKSAKAPTSIVISQSGLGSKTSPVSVSFPTKIAADFHGTSSNDNVVIEKTVVMLENEVVPAPAVMSGAVEAIDKSFGNNNNEKNNLELKYAAISVPPSVVAACEVENAAISIPDDKLNSYEVVTGYSKDESQKSSSLTPLEKPYQAPYARLTSLEDPATRNLTVPESERVPCTESIKGKVSDLTKTLVDQTHGASKKPCTKESKGLRKLLKFGRKSHASASGEGNQDLDASSVDDPMGGTSSNDVHMLKNLITQVDSQAGGTPTKGPRSFSILSPFRSKNNEKQLAA